MADLPPLAAVDDLEARLGRSLSDEDRVRAGAALEDASALVRMEAGRDWATEPVPGAIKAVVLRVARREFTNPDSRTNRQVGPFSESYSAGSGTAYLTDEERAVVARFRQTGSGGLWSLSTTREGPDFTPDMFVSDQFGGDWFLVGDDTA